MKKKEERVFFTVGSIKLEGLYGAADGAKGVVVTHPHPQMGGTMDNNVVEALVDVFAKRGFSTLRFNFRGVGWSGGFYDNGDGEQDDVMAAVTFLKEQKKEEIVLAGYSFGAWIISRLLTRENRFSDVVLVSPPIDFIEFDFTGLEGKIGLIICGDHDQFCPVDKISRIVERIGSQLRIVERADHFYWGREEAIEEHLDRYLAKE